MRSVEVLLTALERSRAKLVFLSSDNVFDGTRETYRERDEPSPINVYGETKVAAERLVLRDPRHLVLRIPLLYGASPFSNKFLGRFARPRTLAQVDVVCAPLYLPSLAAGIADLWERAGLLHLGGAEVVTRFELMSRIQAALGLASEVVAVHDDGDRPGNVRRPRRLVLRSEHHDIVGPDLETALAAWAPAGAGEAGFDGDAPGANAGRGALPARRSAACRRSPALPAARRALQRDERRTGARPMRSSTSCSARSEAAFVTAPLWCDYGFTISIGARSFLNFGTVILDGAAVSIGADVQISPGVQLLTATHPLDPVARRERWESASPSASGTARGWGAG